SKGRPFFLYLAELGPRLSFAMCAFAPSAGDRAKPKLTGGEFELRQADTAPNRGHKAAGFAPDKGAACAPLRDVNVLCFFLSRKKGAKKKDSLSWLSLSFVSLGVSLRPSVLHKELVVPHDKGVERPNLLHVLGLAGLVVVQQLHQL